MTRILDIILSLIAIIILSPLLVPISLILRFTGEGKIFYKQKRIGREKKAFKLMKFATMLEDSPNLLGGDITSGNDPRVLPVGKILRKTKINELPQLFNILKGEISFIGPRPLTPKNFNMYSYETQNLITKVRPGLSGVGSIVFRDEESLITTIETDSFEFYRLNISPYKGDLEKWYIEKNNIMLYGILIFLTLWVVIFPNTKIIWKLFPKLPHPPESLRDGLKFS